MISTVKDSYSKLYSRYHSLNTLEKASGDHFYLGGQIHSGSNYYVLESFRKWGLEIEKHNKIIDLDFNKLSANINELIQKNDKTFVMTMFLNQSNTQNSWDPPVYSNSIFHYILETKSFLFPPYQFESLERQNTKLCNINNNNIHKYMTQCIKILHLFIFDAQLFNVDTIIQGCGTYMYSFYELVKDNVYKMYQNRDYYANLNCLDIMDKYIAFFMKIIHDSKLNCDGTADDEHDIQTQLSLIILADNFCIQSWPRRLKRYSIRYLFSDSNHIHDSLRHEQISFELIKTLILNQICPMQINDYSDEFQLCIIRYVDDLNNDILNENIILKCIDNYDINKKPSKDKTEYPNEPLDLTYYDIQNVCSLFMIYDIYEFVLNQFKISFYECVSCHDCLTKGVADMIVNYLFYDLQRLSCFTNNKYKNNFMIKYYEYVNFFEFVSINLDNNCDLPPKLMINCIFGDMETYLKYEAFVVDNFLEESVRDILLKKEDLGSYYDRMINTDKLNIFCGMLQRNKDLLEHTQLKMICECCCEKLNEIKEYFVRRGEITKYFNNAVIFSEQIKLQEIIVNIKEMVKEINKFST
eukprot:336761_1